MHREWRHARISALPSRIELLKAKSPSGAEGQAWKPYDQFVQPHADAYANDALGNRLATLNPAGGLTVMFAGHMDELGLMITYVNKDGFLYFDTIGGHDRTIISGRRVIIQTAQGFVKGVTGKRAIHLMDEGDRKKVPRSKRSGSISAPRPRPDSAEAGGVGDVATYDHEFELINGSIGTVARSTTRSVRVVGGVRGPSSAGEGEGQAAQIVSVATTQEEIGARRHDSASR